MWTAQRVLRRIRRIGARKPARSAERLLDQANILRGFRHLDVMGRPATFFGRPSDKYFAELQDMAPQNGTLIKELSRLRKDACVIDVGANIGLTAVACSRGIPAGKVLAVEPSPTAYGDLLKSLEASGATNVTAIQACLCRECGSIPFQESDYLGGTVALYPGPTTIDVPLMTLDSLVQRHGLARIDLIKIDVDVIGRAS